MKSWGGYGVANQLKRAEGLESLFQEKDTMLNHGKPNLMSESPPSCPQNIICRTHSKDSNLWSKLEIYITYLASAKAL
jgi:hypothetical protein